MASVPRQTIGDDAGGEFLTVAGLVGTLRFFRQGQASG